MKKTVSFLGRIAALMAISVVMFVGFSSCQKEESDYRQTFAGTYTGNETWANQGIQQTQAITLNVVPSTVYADRIVITSTFYKWPLTEIFEAVVSKDGNFSGTFTSNIDGYSTIINVNNGRFVGNKLTYNYSAQDYVTCSVDVTKM